MLKKREVPDQSGFRLLASESKRSSVRVTLFSLLLLASDTVWALSSPSESRELFLELLTSLFLLPLMIPAVLPAEPPVVLSLPSGNAHAWFAHLAAA